MIRFTNTIEIDRPVDEVFAYLSDLEHTPEWNWAISETRKTTPGPVRVGTTYEQRRSIPKPAREHLEITALEPDQLLEVQGLLASIPAHLSYKLQGHGSRTTLVNTVELHPRAPLRLVAPVVAGRIERAVADNLGTLKTRLEGRASTQPS